MYEQGSFFSEEAMYNLKWNWLQHQFSEPSTNRKYTIYCRALMYVYFIVKRQMSGGWKVVLVLTAAAAAVDIRPVNQYQCRTKCGIYAFVCMCALALLSYYDAIEMLCCSIGLSNENVLIAVVCETESSA